VPSAPDHGRLFSSAYARAVAATPPAAIVLNIADGAVEAPVGWLRGQQNPIGKIPIIGIGAGSRGTQSCEAAVISLTITLLGNALGRVMKKRID